MGYQRNDLLCRHGKRKDWDQEDREHHQSSGYFLQEEKWALEESLWIISSLWCWSCSHRLLHPWPSLWVRQQQVILPPLNLHNLNFIVFFLDLEENLHFFSHKSQVLFDVSFVIISASFMEKETLKYEIWGGYFLNYANFLWVLAFQGVVCQITLFLDLSWLTLISSFLLYTDII